MAEECADLFDNVPLIEPIRMPRASVARVGNDNGVGFLSFPDFPSRVCEHIKRVCSVRSDMGDFVFLRLRKIVGNRLLPAGECFYSKENSVLHNFLSTEEFLFNPLQIAIRHMPKEGPFKEISVFSILKNKDVKDSLF